MNAHGTSSQRERGERSGVGSSLLVVTDAHARVVVWTAAATHLLGHSAADAAGQTLPDLLDIAPGRLSASAPWQGRLTARHQNGRRLELQLSAYPLAADGEPLWLLVSQDHPAVSADPQKTALSDWVLTGSPIAVSVYDTDMRCTRQNAAMRRLCGVPDEDRLGRSLSAALRGPDTAQWESRMRQVLETGTSEEGLVRGRTAVDLDHDHVFSVTASPLCDPDGRIVGLCATALDVSEEHRNRQRLQLLNEASTRIGSTLDVTRTARELTEVVVPGFGDFAGVDLLEALLSGDEPAHGPITTFTVLRRVAHTSVRAGTPEAAVGMGGVDRYTANSPQARCLATGKSELHRVADPPIRKWMEEDEVRGALLEEYGFHSWMIVPVIARGTALGVVIFVRGERPEPFEHEDLVLAEELVARAAVCLDNARRFTRERTTALALQHSLLPRHLPHHSAVDTAFRYLPAAPQSGVGGDWFDVIPLSGARVALVVGDVVGHGIHASATMGRLRTAVRTLADVDLSPDELLTQLDDLVIRLSADSEMDTGTILSSDVGATCLYAVYDPATGHCCVASAGHPAPALVNPDGGVAFVSLHPGPPLGVGGLPFEAADVVLPEGSLLALYTDGLVESRQRAMDAGLGELCQLLAGAAASPLDALCEQVVATLLSGRPADDAALLLARVRRLDSQKIATWDVPRDPEAVARIRAEVVRRLSIWGIEEVAFITELVVSELVTNAIRYGAAPIQLRLVLDRMLICEVADANNAAPHLRRARVFDEGGRGLLLVAQLTQRWGTRQTLKGKVIWCEQALPEAAS
ncbi:SpoIIE family protein phosphatase [Streptomyces sp. RP5T]|uniref:SpoIIE family protein phosphatase n=1 Tax=Streptomyces sp. RP5T TaxID=2490848 RepID=UPI000F6483BE|nr:SpoIIE family protein phosphatase [Streptomyces sp. RP5T]RRR86081.1 PAS domain-containing protein [Streptomyces sp. RP5T]